MPNRFAAYDALLKAYVRSGASAKQRVLPSSKSKVPSRRDGLEAVRRWRKSNDWKELKPCSETSASALGAMPKSH